MNHQRFCLVLILAVVLLCPFWFARTVPSKAAEPEPVVVEDTASGDSSEAADIQSEDEAPAALPAYDFSQPAPESEPVDNSYFSDAAFIGDSRTDGFLIYSGIGCGKNLTSNGLSIFQLADQKALTIDGTEYTLLEALELEQYGKVYLSLGVNELGYNDDEGFYRHYCQAIDAIRAAQPDAIIYVQGLIPVNEEVIAQTTQRTYLTNEHLRVYNELIRQAAEEKQVVFLDLYAAFVNDEGELPADASRDGVHLTATYCQQWLDYLQRHTVAKSSLF
jgi:lysophospholipase L1-like esterase